MADAAGSTQPAQEASRLPAWTPSPRERDDLDLLQTGGYAPLTGFLTRDEVTSVHADARLPQGTPWPVPITLTVATQVAEQATDEGRLALLDDDATLLAVLEVADAWHSTEGVQLGGRIQGVRTSTRWDFPALRRPVASIRAELGGGTILAAQPAGPVDARTAARWTQASEELAAPLLLFPAVAADPQPRQVARVRAYRRALDHLPPSALLRLLPSGREPSVEAHTALHAVVARNAGATHLLLDDDTELDPEVIVRLGLTPLHPARFAAPDDPPAGHLPDAVAAELRRAEPPRTDRGFVVLLTGLSGSGKSTVAKALRARLMDVGHARQVTLLDGDLVRQHLSSELGFSRAHRDLNVRRIGFVASEVAKHGGIAICAPIAPYDRTRREVRDMVEQAGGGFVLVHVATPLEVCEQRDVKGLYASARAGELTGFTGIDDPYEVPQDAEVVLDTAATTPYDAAERIVAHLVSDGWLAPW